MSSSAVASVEEQMWTWWDDRPASVPSAWHEQLVEAGQDNAAAQHGETGQHGEAGQHGQSGADWPEAAAVPELLPRPDCPLWPEAPVASGTGGSAVPDGTERHEVTGRPEVTGRTGKGERDAVVWAVPGVDLPRNALPTAGVEQLRTALRLLADPNALSGLSGRELLEETTELLRLSSELRVLVADRLAAVHARGLHELDGARSVKAWAARVSPDLPAGDVTLGRDLARWPALSAAVHAQTISLGAASSVARALVKAQPHVDHTDGLIDGLDAGAVLDAIGDNTIQLIAAGTLGLSDPTLEQLEADLTRAAALPREIDRVEGCFVLLARHLTPALLRSALDQQLSALVPSALEDDAQTAHDERFLTITRKPHGEGTRTIIDADVETSELLHTCLSAAARRDPHNPQDTATADALRAHGQDPYEPDTRENGHSPTADQATPVRPRSRGQRLHDALVRILEHYRDTGALGTHDKQPVRITVTLPAGQVDGHPGALPALGASGQRIPRSLLQRWWCHSEVTALLMNRTWQALGDTHTQRTATARERRALHVQQGGRCARDGCCDPTDPLTSYEPHHTQRWSKNGNTSLSDTVLVCPSLHHDLHHGRTVTLRNGRQLTSTATWTSRDDRSARRPGRRRRRTRDQRRPHVPSRSCNASTHRRARTISRQRPSGTT